MNNSNENEQRLPNIIRVKHNRENPYVMLNKKSLWDNNLSLDSVGLWARLMTRIDDWEIHVTELMKSCNVGREKIYRMLKELIANGYAFKYQERKSGQFACNVWHIFEAPVSKEEIQKMFPVAEKPSTVKPCAKNTPLISNDNSSSYKSSLDEEKKEEREAAPLSPASSKGKKKIIPLPTGTLFERCSNHSEYSRYIEHIEKPLVAISKEDHEKFIQDFGIDLTIRAYEHLAAWKIDKAKTNPEELFTHTDAGRIKNWVFKALKEKNSKNDFKEPSSNNPLSKPPEGILNTIDEKKAYCEQIRVGLEPHCGEERNFFLTSTESGVVITHKQKSFYAEHSFGTVDSRFKEKLIRDLRTAFPNEIDQIFANSQKNNVMNQAFQQVKR